MSITKRIRAAIRERRQKRPVTKTHQQLKDFLCERGYEEAIVFEDPAYDSAFLGVSDDGRAAYDYELMVESLRAQEGLSYTEAVEFIDYNTIRALPYMGPHAPIIVYPPGEE